MQKQDRLKRNEDIASVVKGRKLARGNFYNIYYEPSSERKIAISVSKKYGHAFERNKAKRIVREITRPIMKDLPLVKAVVVVKSGAKEQPFMILQADLCNQYQYITRRIKPKNGTF